MNRDQSELGIRTNPCPDCRPRVLAGWDIEPSAIPYAGGPSDEAVLGIAMAIRDSTRDPDTGEHRTGTVLDDVQHIAFKTILNKLLDDASEVAWSHDDALLRYAQQMEPASDEGLADLATLPEVLSASYEVPGGGRVAGAEVINDHQRALLRERERPDPRHDESPIPGYWTPLAACGIALLDVVLYWDFIFNLGSLESLTAALKWGAAACLAFIWAGAIHLALTLYKARERACHDRRSAVGDHSYAATRIRGRRRKAAPAWAAPTPAEIETADRQLAVALGFVALCRGSLLGDLIRNGKGVVAEVEDRYGSLIDQARASGDQARALGAKAETAAVHGYEDRLWVTVKYQEAMGWASAWMGLREIPVTSGDIEGRAFPNQDAGIERLKQAQTKLASLMAELGKVSGVSTVAGVQNSPELTESPAPRNVPALRPKDGPTAILAEGPPDPGRTSSLPFCSRWRGSCAHCWPH
ncbi:hypothetical protein Acor_13930 [Acrocarpospora corrugata]|uniref:Uncharacterized protein n=1 Tax=Acrocarpospora corrugata TaxID=35763 RepID=A0A5M3VTV1_9ACTN|nr:hypothetical protein [Acrocarpospora corrugata]GER99329.1 hypothetical protein Acor_13930 [Acrocarpospora corrugata]